MQETTGWYRLQIEPQPGDAGEAIGSAAITVARRDATVRARPLLLRGTATTDTNTTAATAGGASTSTADGARPSATGTSAAAASGLAGNASAAAAHGSATTAVAGGLAGNASDAGAGFSIGPAGLASLRLTLVPPFTREQVLAPAVLGTFLDQLLARTTQPSASLTAAVARARAGDLAGAASASTLAELATVDAPAASFLRGLSLFAQPTVEALEAAATQFRDTLRGAPDFYPAAFYLGACYAAGHRDREAAGAWQTALITLSDVPVVYLVLSDAWLRLRDPGRATGFLDEASEHWPQDVAVTTRRVPAALLAGRAGDALATIDHLLAPASSPPPQPQPQPQPRIDAETLFAGICLLHDALLARRPIVSEDDDRRRLQRYADAYRAANGAQQAEVTRLIAEITPR